jgi:hypothetical protein
VLIQGSNIVMDLFQVFASEKSGSNLRKEEAKYVSSLILQLLFFLWDTI